MNLGQSIISNLFIPAWVLWVVAVAAAAAFWSISATMKHHWDEQEFAKEKINQAQKLYFQVSYVLLLSLFLMAIFYSIYA